MTPPESAELGSVLHRLVPAVKAATGVQRVYFLALMERAPHFHLWLIPKKNEGELRGVDYLAQQPPLTDSGKFPESPSDAARSASGRPKSWSTSSASPGRGDDVAPRFLRTQAGQACRHQTGPRQASRLSART